MKISYLFGYTLSAIWWLFVVLIQILVPVTFVLGIIDSSGFFGMCLILTLAALPLTAWCGGLNTVPSIVWRFRKNLNTRIVEQEGVYALQMKVLGGWIYVDASEGETNSIMTAWIDDISAYPFMLSKKSKIVGYRDRLEQELRDGFNVPKHAIEVLSEHVISR